MFLTPTKITILAVNSRGGIVCCWPEWSRPAAKVWLAKQLEKYADVGPAHTYHGIRLDDREEPVCKSCEERQRIIQTLTAKDKP
tara:strand:+ start:1052 stop:1303 length:252 start_codon:yes stop_codon:yes gene_type:complete